MGNTWSSGNLDSVGAIEFNFGTTFSHELVDFSSGIKGEIETGLANTFKATGKLKAEANAQIKALEAIINKNKAAVDSARAAPATTKAEQKRINDASIIEIIKDIQQKSSTNSMKKYFSYSIISF